ncbi:MAG: YfhO family protein [Candidatus Sumerlaeia bacterium]
MPSAFAFLKKSIQAGGHRFSGPAFLTPLLLLVLVLLVGSPLLFGGQTIAGNGDIISQYLPYKQLVRDQISRGIFPHWNPMTFSGRPLMADIQIGLFYPFNIFFWILPLSWAFDLATLFHIALGMVGMSLWLRRYISHGIPRFLASALFYLSAFSATRIWAGVVIFHFAMAWIPWMLLAWDRLDESMRDESDRRGRDLLFLTATLVFSVLTGAPQITFYSFAILGLYALFISWKGRGASSEDDAYDDAAYSSETEAPMIPMPLRLKPLLWLFAAFFLAGGICAAQLMPTARFMGQSWDRAFGASWEFIVDGSLQYRSLLMVLSPFFFGKPFDEAWYWGQESGGYHEISAYAGVLPIFLAAIFLCFRWNLLRRGWLDDIAPARRSRFTRFELFLVLLLFGGLAFAPGRHSPFFWLAYHLVPGFDRFRVPARFILLYTFALSVLAGYVLDRFMSRKGKAFLPKKAIIAVGILALIAAGASIILAITTPQLMEYFQNPHLASEHGGWTGRFAGGLVQLKAVARSGFIISALAFAVGGILIIAITVFPVRKPKGIQAIALLIAALSLFEILSFGYPFLKTTKRSELYEIFTPHTERVDFLQQNLQGRQRFLWMDSVRSYQVDQNSPELLTNMPILFDLYNTRGYDPVNSRRYGLFTNICTGLPLDLNPGGMMFFIDTDPEVIQWRLIALWNCPIVLSYTEIGHPAVELAKAWDFFVPQRKTLYAYRIKDLPGSAWLSKPYYLAGDLSMEKIAGMLMSEKFDPRNLAVITEMDPRLAIRKLPQAEKQSQLRPEVELLEANPTRRKYRVQTPDLATLVLSESYYPGWKARIDGHDALTYPANIAFIATTVPPGDHTVEFIYQTPGLRSATLISIASLLLLILLARKLRQSGDEII